MFREKASMLGLIGAVLILIAAFVALKTVDLILPQQKTEEDSLKKDRSDTHYSGNRVRPV